MSLWHKSLNEIEFADVEEFCQLRLPEGRRLDYKREIPRDFHNLVAAFANTFGGLVVLGVDSDSENKPVWPPPGMPDAKGIPERIIQLCRDKIYPPVQPEIGLTSNTHSQGTVLAVVRVSESPEAPHAVPANNPKYVYERTDNQNHPIDVANIHRIEHLLARRHRIEEQREACIDQALASVRRKKAHLSDWTGRGGDGSAAKMDGLAADEAVCTGERRVAVRSACWGMIGREP